MNPKALIESILQVAKAAAPLVGHGLPEAIALGTKVIDLIDNTKKILGGDYNMTELLEQRDALEARVNEHVDRTTSKLRGE